MWINKVYLGNCIEIMRTLSDKSINLVFADLPFNIEIKYDIHNNSMPYD